MRTPSVGSLVTYQTVASGFVTGEVVATGTDRFGPFVRIKTTKRERSAMRAYPLGDVFTVGVSNFVTAR